MRPWYWGLRRKEAGLPSTQIRNALQAALRRRQLPRTSKLLRMPLRLLRARLSRLFGKIECTASLVSGDSMTVILPEPVSTGLYAYGFHDAPVCHMMLDHVRQGDTVLDIGSHFGFFALLAARLVCGTTCGSVHAFEPTPNTFRMLKANTSGYEHIVVNECAVGGAVGTATLQDFGLLTGAWNTIASVRLPSVPAGARGIVVRTVTVDSYCRERRLRPDFVKIDAEGATASILDGMSDMLAASGPLAIAAEMDDSEDEAVVELLLSAGFQLHAYNDSGHSRRVDDPSCAALSEKDVLFVRG